MHLRVRYGLERKKDLVELDHSAADVAQERQDDALVPKRQELPRLRTERDPRRAERRSHGGADTPRPRRHERREQRE
jgi:hypothetical protein